MTASTSELAFQIADIIAFEPEKFDIHTIETVPDRSCGTQRCIAGWAGHLTSDGWAQFMPLSALQRLTVETLAAKKGEWLERQAFKIGITPEASSLLFFNSFSKEVLEAVLRTLAKETAERGEDDLVTLEELIDILEEAARDAEEQGLPVSEVERYAAKSRDLFVLPR